MTPRTLRSAAAGLAVVLLALATSGCSIPGWGRDVLLHPWRRSTPPAPRIAHDHVELAGEGIALKGWRFRATPPRRGVVVYLHGLSDDRRGGAGIAERFTPRGFDVIAYDLRAHGASGGAACTYGVLEKADLSRVLDGEAAGPVVLIGFSLGGAIALQAAAEDARIACVVAIEPFSDLRTVVKERAPFFVTESQVDEALRLSERDGGFSVDAASPVRSAPRIRCPVLLVHGAEDVDTPPAHSQRIHAALTCDKELVLVPGVGHDDPLGEATWRRIEAAIDAAVR